MSLDKAIEHGKEKRRRYWGSKEFDRSCRNHGSCGWCRDKVKYKRAKAELAVEPTPMPEWLERQLDNAERTVAEWSDAKCEAAGIPRNKDKNELSS